MDRECTIYFILAMMGSLMNGFTKMAFFVVIGNMADDLSEGP